MREAHFPECPTIPLTTKNISHGFLKKVKSILKMFSGLNPLHTHTTHPAVILIISIHVEFCDIT